MTDHVEFLKKVSVAKKHYAEYRRKDVSFYAITMIIAGLISVVIGVSNILASTVMILFAFTFGGFAILRKAKNENEFEEKFKEEALLLEEYDELME